MDGGGTAHSEQALLVYAQRCAATQYEKPYAVQQVASTFPCSTCLYFIGGQSHSYVVNTS